MLLKAGNIRLEGLGAGFIACVKCWWNRSQRLELENDLVPAYVFLDVDLNFACVIETSVLPDPETPKLVSCEVDWRR